MNAAYVMIDGVAYSPKHKKALALYGKPSTTLLSVGAVDHPKREHRALRTLVKGPQKLSGRKGSLAIIVTIVSFRSRLLDEDNLIAGAKPLRDSIARSLALDDASPIIKWEYRQIVTDGEHGTQVLITSK